MRRISIFIFFIASLAEVFDVMFLPAWYHFVSKPFIIISLIVFYLSSTSVISRMLLVALVFSWGGDVFLLLKDEMYFMLGLVSFLTAHIFFIVGYSKLRWKSGIPLSGPQRARLAFPFMLMGTGLVVILFPYLGDLKIPVIIYASALIAMVITALYRYGYTSATSYWLVFGGAVLFMISDASLAINKFMMPFECAGNLVMATYASAQFMIVNGFLKHQEKRHQ